MSTVLTKEEHPHLAGIKKIIAVSSAKGGVGKSTVAAHLARTLVQGGKRVGLLDADIFGPSVPILFGLEGAQAKSVQKVLQPLEQERIKLMSFGFLLSDQPAILRGPMVGRYIKHLLTQTQWDELDVLLIDFPPGTGDVPLTITQTVALDGALIVTTPHSLALADVERGIQMFRRMRVPVLGIVENMAYVEAGGAKNYIFGQLDQECLEKEWDAKFTAHIPIDPELSSLETTQAFQSIQDLLSA